MNELLVARKFSCLANRVKLRKLKTSCLKSTLVLNKLTELVCVVVILLMKHWARVICDSSMRTLTSIIMSEAPLIFSDLQSLDGVTYDSEITYYYTAVAFHCKNVH